MDTTSNDTKTGDKKTVTLINSFHATRYTVRGYSSIDEMTDALYDAESRNPYDRTDADRRIIALAGRTRRALCGIAGCTCATSPFGTR